MRTYNFVYAKKIHCIKGQSITMAKIMCQT